MGQAPGCLMQTSVLGVCRHLSSRCGGPPRRAARSDALDACAIAGHASPQGDGGPDAIFVRDGAIWSSAGVTTGIDLALALIEQDAGREVAMNVARILVVYPKRAGGQSQFSVLLAAQAESVFESFSELQRAGLRPALAFFSVSLRISAGWCRSAGCECAWPWRRRSHSPPPEQRWRSGPRRSRRGPRSF
jgi:hypothetical protein